MASAVVPLNSTASTSSSTSSSSSASTGSVLTSPTSATPSDSEPDMPSSPKHSAVLDALGVDAHVFIDDPGFALDVSLKPARMEGAYTPDRALEDLPVVKHALNLFLASHMVESEQYLLGCDPKKFV